MVTSRFDYVVVGAGSSGASVARRLCERGSTVVLLEAGEARQDDFWIRVPLGIGRILGDPNYVWQFNTEPQSDLAGQCVYWPRGRLLGGSSSVNGMVFVRGDPAEYDCWRDQGNVGWGWDDVLPYFMRMECAKVGDDNKRGRQGPIHVSSLSETPDKLSDAFLSSCREVGIPTNADYNSGRYGGASYLQLSTSHGRRSSTATGYLRQPHRLLTVQTRAVARRVMFDGRRAKGVEFLQNGNVHHVLAEREVILSAGPLKTPQLLELSGVGDGPRLQDLGVDVVQHLPGVGENLIDHLQSRLCFACTRPITLNEVVGSSWRRLWMGARYLATGRGLMATPACTVHALAPIEPDAPRASVKIQLHHMSGNGRGELASAGAGLDTFPGFSIGFFQLRPESRGSVHACHPNLNKPPRIDPRYLAHESDRRVALEGLRLARRIARQPSLAPYIMRETRPGAAMESDVELLDYIKRSGQTSFHPVGTCRMGTDELAVVDPRLRVRGVSALRVVDSSVMPTLPSSNTNAPSIMIGEKAADLIQAI